jgi:hypothetical protein
MQQGTADYRAARDGQDRPIGELFGKLASETGTLVRQEMKLATGELQRKAAYASRQVVVVAAGSLVGLASLLILLLSLVLVLGAVMKIWLASLIVGLVVAAVAGSMVLKGAKALRTMEPKPTETIRSLQDTKAWVQEQVR